MREFINIINEAKMAKKYLAPKLDTGALIRDTKNVMSELSKGPFDIKFSKKLTDTLQDRISFEKVNYDLMDAEDRGGDFSAAEVVQDAAMRVWKESNFLFLQVRQDCDYEIGEYQQRAAERHGRLDDLDFLIESSDFLTAMEAQSKLASYLDLVDFKNLSDLKPEIARISHFIQVFKDCEHPTDDGEAPFLIESLVSGLSEFLPLVALTAMILDRG